MSRAVQDLETLRACVMARMSAASIAMTLGRSLKWVEARIREIEEEEEQDVALVEPKAPSASPEPQRAPEAKEDHDADREQDRGWGSGKEPAANGDLRSPGPKGDGDPLPALSSGAPEADPAERIISEVFKATASISAPRPPAALIRAADGAPRGVERLKPVTARVAGWAWWFRAAGWPMDVVAGLFDRDVDALAAAVEALR